MNDLLVKDLNRSGSVHFMCPPSEYLIARRFLQFRFTLLAAFLLGRYGPCRESHALQMNTDCL